MTCPSEEALVQFARGAVSQSARERIANHLDTCSICIEVLAQATVNTVAGPAATDGAATALPRGTSIGRYLVLDRIGAGGLGEVYAAYDPKLDRRVALKLIKSERMGTVDGGDALDSAAQTLREARALAKLSHPNVVPVFDVDERDGRIFIAMELVEGQTLDQWRTEKDRSWSEIRDVFLQAGEGLAAAHAAGLVHRDFKPSNVLVAKQGRTYVVDFGLARRYDAHEAGVVAGTPAYMAPEQWSAQPVTAMADQFAFCVSLYEALYGTRPFAGPDLDSTRRAVLNGDVAKPRRGGGGPTWLRQAILRGLRTQPSNRHASMRHVLRALSRDKRTRRVGRLAVAGGVLVSATVTWFVARANPPPPDLEQLQALVREARTAAEDARYVYPPAEDPEARAAYEVVLELERLEREGAELDAGRAARLRAEFAQRLIELGDRYWDRPGGRAFAIDYYAGALLFDESAERAGQRAALTPGELRDLRSRAERGDFEPAQLDAAEPLAALAEPDENARAARLAKLYRRKRRPGIGTTAHLEQLLDDKAATVLRGDTPQDKPAAHVAEHPPSAVAEAASPAKPESSPAAMPRQDARRQLQLGEAAAAQGRLAEAKRRYHRALEASPRSTAALSRLSRLHFQEGDYSKALEFARRATDVAPDRAKFQLQVGDAAYNLYRYDEARRAYLRAKQRGSKQADARLAKVAAKVGADR